MMAWFFPVYNDANDGESSVLVGIERDGGFLAELVVVHVPYLVSLSLFVARVVVSSSCLPSCH